MIKSLSEVFSVATQYLVPVSKMATAAEVGFTRETKSNGRQTKGKIGFRVVASFGHGTPS